MTTESGDINLSIMYANTTLQDTPDTQLVVVLNTGVDYISDTHSGVYDANTHSITFALGNLS